MNQDTGLDTGFLSRIMQERGAIINKWLPVKLKIKNFCIAKETSLVEEASYILPPPNYKGKQSFLKFTYFTY